MKRKKPASVKKRVAKTPIIVKVSLVIIVLFVIFATTFKVVEVIITNKTNNFPKLEISLKDITVERLDSGTKDVKYPDNTVAITANNETTTYDNVEVKGRGNFTWKQLKKPYQIKFSEKTDLFNHGATKKWVLLADYLDESHLRNDITFYLADLLDQNYNYQGDPIELYIDGNYRGLYYIVKKIDTNKAGVNLKNDDGILVELDNNYGELDGCSYDSKGNCFVEKDIINENFSASAMEDFISSIDSLHKATSSKDFESIEKIIDVDSFVNYYLLNEFTVNPDAYSSSFYMYKDGKDDKIHAGPIWDFDMALSNNYWTAEGVNPNDTQSPFRTMSLRVYLNEPDVPYASSLSTVIYDLIDIPDFSQRVKEVYQDVLSGKKDVLLDYIQSQADYIRPAVLRDQERWKLKFNFDEEIDYLIDWVAKRCDHFEQTYGVNSNQVLEYPQPELEQLSPQEMPPSA